jgi:hypothetical protein
MPREPDKTYTGPEGVSADTLMTPAPPSYQAATDIESQYPYQTSRASLPLRYRIGRCFQKTLIAVIIVGGMGGLIIYFVVASMGGNGDGSSTTQSPDRASTLSSNAEYNY